MTIWTELARATTASGDEILLRQREFLYEIRYNGINLMSNNNFQSELQLALRGMRRREHRAKRILIGGLGMGFTTRAVLDLARSDAEVTVCELIPEVADWNRGVLGPLAGHPLRDPRTKLIVGDVQTHIAESKAAYDLILLDTDNGPDYIIRDGNAELYQGHGVASVFAALAPQGLAAFWSATASEDFEAVLARQSWAWTREDVCLVPDQALAMHHIYLCAADAAGLATSCALPELELV